MLSYSSARWLHAVIWLFHLLSHLPRLCPSCTENLPLCSWNPGVLTSQWLCMRCPRGWPGMLSPAPDLMDAFAWGKPDFTQLCVTSVLNEAFSDSPSARVRDTGGPSLLSMCWFHRYGVSAFSLSCSWGPGVLPGMQCVLGECVQGQRKLVFLFFLFLYSTNGEKQRWTMFLEDTMNMMALC